jgi:hypothetical protein
MFQSEVLKRNKVASKQCQTARPTERRILNKPRRGNKVASWNHNNQQRVFLVNPGVKITPPCPKIFDVHILT